MKTVSTLALIGALVTLAPVTTCRAADEGGVALAIVYDTSGSMRDPVRDASGRMTPKYLIANRALVALARQVQTFTTNKAGSPPRRVDAGLFVFHNNGARQAIKFGPFEPSAFEEWAKNFSKPSGNTPLGNAVNTAARAILESPLPHKHVLVITDGMNTSGPEPSVVLPKLKRAADQKGTSLAVHFIAFDVDAKVFEPVKKQGATVVSAADEKQLNTQVDYILQRKILLEEEEPKKP